MKVPGGSNVDKSFVALKKTIKASLRQTNEEAGRLLSKAKYERAEILVGVAKAVDSFRAEVENLHPLTLEGNQGRKQ